MDARTSFASAVNGDVPTEVLRKVVSEANSHSKEVWEQALRISAGNKLTHYEVLQVSKTSTVETIKARYKTLSLALHPDKLQCPESVSAEEFAAFNAEAMKRLNEAKNVLTNPLKRQEYDNHLQDSALDRDDDDDDDAENAHVIISGLLGGGPAPSTTLRSLIPDLEKEFLALKVNKNSPNLGFMDLLAKMTDVVEVIQNSAISHSGSILLPLPPRQGRVVEEKMDFTVDFWSYLSTRASKISSTSLIQVLQRASTKFPLLDCHSLNDRTLPKPELILQLPTKPVNVEMKDDVPVVWEQCVRSAYEMRNIARKGQISSKFVLPSKVSLSQIDAALHPQLPAAPNGQCTSPDVAVGVATPRFFNLPKEFGALNMTITVQAMPTWISPKDRSACHKCSHNFGWFSGNSHCRACGEVFCKSCVTRATVLPRYGLIRACHKVCDRCYDAEESEGRAALRDALIQRSRTEAKTNLVSSLGDLRLVQDCFHLPPAFWQQIFSSAEPSLPLEWRLCVFSLTSPSLETCLTQFRSLKLPSSSLGFVCDVFVSETGAITPAQCFSAALKCAESVSVAKWEDCLTLVALSLRDKTRCEQMLVSTRSRASSIVRILFLLMSEQQASLDKFVKLTVDLERAFLWMLRAPISLISSMSSFSQIVRGSSNLELIEWSYLQRDTSPMEWLDLACSAFTQGTSIKTDWLDLTRRCLYQCGRSQKQPPQWLSVAELNTNVKILLCTIQHICQDDPTCSPDGVWRAAASYFAKAKNPALAMYCLSVRRLGTKDMEELWHQLSLKSQDSFFLAAELCASLASPGSTNWPTTTLQLSRLLSETNAEVALDLLVVLLCSGEENGKKAQRLLQARGLSKCLSDIAQLLIRTKQPSTLILGSLQAAAEKVENIPEELQRSLTQWTAKVRESAQKKVLADCFPIFMASLSYNDGDFVNALLAVFDQGNAAAIEEFLSQYRQRFVSSEEKEETLYPQIRAVIELSLGCLSILRQEIAVGAQKILLALSLAPSEHLSRAACHILSKPSTRFSGLADIHDTLALANSYADILSAPWLCTPTATATNDLTLPTDFITPINRFSKSTMRLLRPTRVFEVSIAQVARLDGHFEAAMSYFDLIVTAPTPAAVCTCFLQAARHFLLVQQDSTQSAKDQYVAFKLAHACLELAMKNERPHILAKMQTLRSVIWLFIRSFASNTIPGAVTDDLLTQVSDLIRELVSVSRLVPIFSLPPVRVYDSILVDLVLRGLSQKVVVKLGDQLAGLLPRDEWACIKFEGSYFGWLTPDEKSADEVQGMDGDEDDLETKVLNQHDIYFFSLLTAEEQEAIVECVIQTRAKGERVNVALTANFPQFSRQEIENLLLLFQNENNVSIDFVDRLREIANQHAERREEQRDRKRRQAFFEQMRFDTIAELLHEGKVSWNETGALINCLDLPRDPDGFLLSGNVPKRYEFASFDGFKLEKSTGMLKLRLTKASSAHPGLFDMADLKQVMALCLEQAVFSLDDIDPRLHSNPLQIMHFSPVAARGTALLAEMFHADYLLKFFTTGVEVSHRPPFPLRLTSKGLLRGLPPHLITGLSVCAESESSKENRAHRFWLDAGTLPYDETDDDDKIEYTFGTVDMRVKKHLLQRNPHTGALEDSTLPESDTSVEAEFARFFSRHYTEIATHFPTFARVREFAKITAGIRVMSSVRTGLHKMRTNLNNSTSRIAQAIADNTLKQVKWPDWETADQLVEKTISENNVPYAQRDEARRQLRPKAQEAVETRSKKFVDSVVSQLSSVYGVSSYSVASDVSRHLNGNYGATNALATTLASAQISQEDRKIATQISAFAGLGTLAESKGLSTGPVTAVGKGWVPATFRRREMESGRLCLVLGGVSLCPNLQQQRVNPPAISQYHNSGTAQAAQRSNGWANSFAQMQDNNAARWNQHNQNMAEFWRRNNNNGGIPPGGGNGGNNEAHRIVGRSDAPLNFPQAPKGQRPLPARNTEAYIQGTTFVDHAVDRLQERGIPATVVNSIVQNNRPQEANKGRERYYCPENNISVITENNGRRVVTVRYGGK